MIGFPVQNIWGQPSVESGRKNCWKLTALPDLISFVRGDEAEGFSAAYGGMIAGIPVIAGGCNFPGRPAAKGGLKKYYREIYALRGNPEKKGKWEKVGRLPVAAACGVSITVPEGLLCIGGRNEDSSFGDVWLLAWNADTSGIILTNLPPLPVAMDNMGGGTDGKSVFVGGGNIDGQLGNRCFVLENIQASEWKELPVFPGPARIQPVGAVYSGKEGTRFYLMGGFQPGNQERESVVSTNGVYWDTAEYCWHTLDDMLAEGERDAFTLVGASGVLWNEDYILVQGGVNREIFKAAIDNSYLQGLARENPDELLHLQKEQAAYMMHEPEWYKFNSRLLLYHIATDTWEIAGNWPEIAKAGSVFINDRGRLIVVNGETKPGIRSAGVYLIEWCDYKNKSDGRF